MSASAERISLCGETAWIWKTRDGWNVLQGPYQVDLENVEQDGHIWHMIDWLNHVPRSGDHESGLAKHEPGHLGRDRFLELAETILSELRRANAPPTPPLASKPSL
jgi:hypothetical protein